MRVSYVMVVTIAAVLGAAGAAWAVGPWPGLAASVQAPSGDARYAAARAGGATTVRKISADGRILASKRLTGAFGIPAVTSDGEAGGLSPDGRLLVLAEPPNYDGLRRAEPLRRPLDRDARPDSRRSPSPASSASTRSPPTGGRST